MSISLSAILRKIVCAVFAFWLILTASAGYVRYTTEERQMLNQMTKDYTVDPVYVLDMYQHGKVRWMLDLLLRLAVLFVAGMVMITLRGALKR